MRQFFPAPSAVDTTVEAVYSDILGRAEASAAAGRTHVVVGMVHSVDGAIALDGLSGGLSGTADKEVFRYLRSLADVILVGAATAREEDYGQPRLTEELRNQRIARGQAELPRIAVVSRSMRIDWSSRLFGDPASPAGLPLVIGPTSAPPQLWAPAAGIAEPLRVGEQDVDFASVLDQLRARGARLVLCEGGPRINALLLSAGLVDELCLTVSPVLVGGRGARLSGWDDPRPGLAVQLLSGCEAEGALLLRYALKPASQDRSSAGPG